MKLRRHTAAKAIHSSSLEGDDGDDDDDDDGYGGQQDENSERSNNSDYVENDTIGSETDTNELASQQITPDHRYKVFVYNSSRSSNSSSIKCSVMDIQ